MRSNLISYYSMLVIIIKNYHYVPHFHCQRWSGIVFPFGELRKANKLKIQTMKTFFQWKNVPALGEENYWATENHNWISPFPFMFRKCDEVAEVEPSKCHRNEIIIIIIATVTGTNPSDF